MLSLYNFKIKYEEDIHSLLLYSQFFWDKKFTLGKSDGNRECKSKRERLDDEKSPAGRRL